MKDTYKKQVALLIDILTEIAKAKKSFCFRLYRVIRIGKILIIQNTQQSNENN